MKLTIEIDDICYQADLSRPFSIAIPLLPNELQPNHFEANDCVSQPLVSGDFIGDTTKGGSCNCQQITMTPHCNGTHTESISHIVNTIHPVYQAIEEPLFPTVLISIEPKSFEQTSDDYLPLMDNGNRVITRADLVSKLAQYDDEQLVGLVIRTLPNLESKQSAIYNSDNYPAFLTNDAMSYIVERGVKHLMVDLPSVDKMYDQGKLSNHRIFWGVNLGETYVNNQSETNKTISEMVYVSNKIEDGFYCCNLQLPEIKTDAVPSRPVLYSFNKASN